MPRHADQVELSKKVGAAFRSMKEQGVLTDAAVAAANTVAGITTAITTGVTAATNHGELEPQLTGFLRAVEIGAAIGDLTDGLINPLTTVDGLIALTADSLITGSQARSNFLP